MVTQFAFLALIVAVGFERIAELVVARRNAAWSFSRDGVEFGARHYPVMVAIHMGLLFGAIAEVFLLNRPFIPALAGSMLVLALLSQGLRWWVIKSLGPMWNTRIIVIPGARLVQKGPFKYMKHPNYLAVIVEGIALPLIHTAWITALVFTICNLCLLSVRISEEDRALRLLKT